MLAPPLGSDNLLETPLSAYAWTLCDQCAMAVQQEMARTDPRVGYQVRVQNRVCGRWLRFGGKGRDHHLRLFRRDAASYLDRRRWRDRLERHVGCVRGIDRGKGSDGVPLDCTPSAHVRGETAKPEGVQA